MLYLTKLEMMVIVTWEWSGIEETGSALKRATIKEDLVCHVKDAEVLNFRE